jgi:serine/threonine protein kinase/WD40 repeat protein
MNGATSDRNLLVGILAVQMDFIRRDQLIAAMNSWVLEKRSPLEEILERHRALDRQTRELLEALVARHLAMHDNDAEKSLQALSSVGSVKDELRSITDPDVTLSVHRLAMNGDPLATHPQAAGSMTSEGQRFRILRPHAKGGLGEVHVALDTELNREVALKEIQAPHADHPDSRARFTLEAEITGGLEHPGIVPVYGLGTYADGRPYYAMRFIRGDSMKDAVERFFYAEWNGNEGERSLAQRKLLGRFIDVCNAIEYAHSRGVLHRDLKPGNIMLGKFGETLVVDWGLAKSLGSPSHREHADGESNYGLDDERPLVPASGSGSVPTQMGTAMGTPAYMSPEQAAGRLDELGPASDVYSLGATLYHVLTGYPPFAGVARDGELLRHVQRGAFPPPRSINQTIPRALEAICLKAMALKAADRYPTPARLAEDIEHWLADEPVSAASETLVERSARFVRKHKSWALTTAAAVCLIALVATVAAVLINQQKNENAELASDNLQLATDAKTQLAESLYQQANSLWLGGRIGWRGQALKAVARSAEIQPGERLRDIAVQALLSSDLSQVASAKFEEPVQSVALRPDGKQAALVLADRLRLCDFDGSESGYSLTTAIDGLKDVSILRYSGDGRRLLIGTLPGDCIVWDIPGRRQRWSHTFQTNTEPGVAFGPGADQVTWSNGERIEVWNCSTDSLVAQTELVAARSPATGAPLGPPDFDSTPGAPAPGDLDSTPPPPPTGAPQPPPALPADGAPKTSAIHSSHESTSVASTADWIWRYAARFSLSQLTAPIRSAFTYRAFGAPAEPSRATTPWRPDAQGPNNNTSSVWDGVRSAPPGRTTVITGGRTPWIIVAREHDQVVVTKLNGTEIQKPVYLDGIPSHENVFLALTSDERHLILAHNEPYFAVRPEGAPPAPEALFPTAPAPDSLFPTAPAPDSAPPAGPESAPPMPESAPPETPLPPNGGAVPTAAPRKNRSAANLPIKESRLDRNQPSRGARDVGNIASFVYGLVGVAFLQDRGITRPAPELPPSPIPARVQQLLQMSEEERSRLQDTNPAAKNSASPTSPDAAQPLPPAPEQPRVPMAASGTSLGALASGPTRPAIFSMIDLADYSVVSTMELGLGTVNSLSTCSEDDLLFAAGRARMTVFLRCEGGRLGLSSTWLPVEQELTAAASASDGRRFITVEKDRLAVWQREGLEYASQLNSPSDAWCQCQLTDGEIHWALVNEWGGLVRLIDWEQDRELAQFDNLGASAVAASGNGKAVSTVDHQGNLQVFRFQQDADGRWAAQPLAWSQPSQESSWSTTAITSDARWIVVGGYQNPSAVYELAGERYEFRRFIGPEMTVHELALSTVAKVAAVAYLDRALRLLDFESGKVLAEKSFDSHPAGMSFSPDGRLLASGALGGPASLLDAKTLELVGKLDADEVAWSTVFSPKSDRVAVGNRAGDIAIWDVTTRRRIVQWKGHESGVTELLFADDHSLISTDSRGSVRRWNLGAVRGELNRLGVASKDW